MIVPGFIQTLSCYQGNLVMACEKLYILIVKRTEILWPPRRPSTHVYGHLVGHYPLLKLC